MGKHGSTNEILENESPDQARGTRRILEEYLSQLNSIHAAGAGVPEVTYYPALSNLFNAAGKALKPKVRCVMGLRNMGAGLPDGGLFTADQFQHQADGTPKTGQKPVRGAIEAKGTKPDVQSITESQQVKDYLNTYGIVLVTNLRAFVIVERGENGQPATRESFALAKNEEEFWQQKAAHPRATAQQKGAQFLEFLKRCCLHSAPLTTPKDVAWFLASYARDGLFRVEQQKELPALQTLRSALEEALGMKFTAEKGEHFFRSTLVQTLFYGIFSAWVRWHKDNPGPSARFDWRSAAWSLYIPFIGPLYSELARPGPERLGGLGLVEVLDWAGDVLNRVDNRTAFFDRLGDEYAVQYFYEPFLEAYDPELRKELGVWYTPREVARFQVARVDQVLREELRVEDGLANPDVIILDPCCGTGTYLVEVLKVIATTLREKHDDAAVGSDLKTAAMTRVFGFEIMPAPYVVAHLQLGLVLRAHNVPLSQENGEHERVPVYLTNALTGWESSDGAQQRQTTMLPDLQREHDAAKHVKGKTIIVVLGNPPYNAFHGVCPLEEEGLVDLYKVGLNKPIASGGWGIKKFNLDDLYVRFFRLAERRIAEMSGRGVISFISNFSYLSDPSFVVMRRRFLDEFDKLWLDCMNGDSRETGKLTPDGKPDPSVFSTDYNREGIRVGTAVCVIVRKAKRRNKPVVRFRQFWGATKRADLLQSLNVKDIDAAYGVAQPCPENRFSFRPEKVTAEYNAWPAVVALCGEEPISGLQEMRKGALSDMSRDNLASRLQAYFDKSIDWTTFAAAGGGLAIDGGRFNAKACRAKMLSAAAFSEDNIRRYSLYPFDNRWCYHSNLRPLWNEPRPDVVAQCWTGNRFFVTRPFAERPHEWAVMTSTPNLPDYHLLRPNTVAIPVRLRTCPSGSLTGLFDNTTPHANLSKPARAYLETLGISDPDANANVAGMIWMHALAIGYSPAYLTENGDGIRRNWPRIPLPDSRKALEESAELGQQVVALLDTESEVAGVTASKIDPLLRPIGVLSRVGGGTLDPDAGDLAVDAGWGHAGKGGVTMPARGRIIDREYDKAEREALAAAAEARGLSLDRALLLLGPATRDVYLNDVAYWRNVPANVWEYRIGGYQVVKKWLSYREKKLLGRALRAEEAREVTNMARRLAAIILMQPALDENYRKVREATFDWTRATG